MAEFRASVVIPLYNKAPFIRRSLASVLEQTLTAQEILVIDDGSTDNSAREIQDLVGDTVRVLRQANAGPGPARNRGVTEAIGDWVAFLDADDVWLPNHLETLRQLSEAFPEAGMIGTGYGRGKPGEPAPDLDVAPVAGKRLDYFNRPVGTADFCSSSVAIKREALADIEGFGAFYPGEDRDMWTRIALNHKIAVSEKRTAIYVRQTGGLMESFEGGRVGFFLPTLYQTLKHALANEKFADQHPALLKHYRALLKLNVRQSIYRGEASAARSYIREIRKTGPAKLGMLRPLVWVPSPLLRAGIAGRSFLRRGYPRKICQLVEKQLRRIDAKLL